MNEKLSCIFFDMIWNKTYNKMNTFKVSITTHMQIKREPKMEKKKTRHRNRNRQRLVYICGNLMFTTVAHTTAAKINYQHIGIT